MIPRAHHSHDALADIRAALKAHRPALAPDAAGARAAVAIVLTSQPPVTHAQPADAVAASRVLPAGAAPAVAAPPQVLLIQRAVRERDPWSGQMAFPGGRVENGDANPAHTAQRETHEETGLSLAGAELLGRLDDLSGRRGTPARLTIAAFVYHLPVPGALALQPSEVQHAFFFPFDELANPARHVRRRFPETGADAYPGIVVGEHERHVVWGLTYRFIESLHEVCARRFPAEPETCERASTSSRKAAPM